MRNIKSIYTKAHFGEQTFAQMPHKDICNLYKNSISFFLIFNNRKLSRNTRKRKQERYSNNVFENNGKKECNTNKVEVQLPIDIKKQSIFQKIINKFKNIFKR